VSWTLGELARRVDGEVHGDPHRRVERVRPLDDAGPDDLSFVSSGKFLAAARRSAAGALLVARSAPVLDRDQIRVADPGRALATVLELFHPRARPAAGVHPTAVVADGARVDPGATIGPFAVVGSGTTIAEGAVIHAHVVVGEGCAVGAGTVLHPHVVLYPGVRLGAGVEVHAGAVLGADGFGYASSREGHHKIPQVGGLELGDDVEIGALSAIDRGALVDTRVGAGSKIDNLVQVGHNVQIGRHALLCGQAGVAGSAKLGDFVVLAGQVGVADHVEIGDGVQVASKSAVLSDLPAGEQFAGIPAVEIGEWRRRRVLEGKLGEMWRALRRLLRRFEEPGGGEGGASS
jgi:UDP-3-O-[3-hydroxymyristoyl] glucosamine N-acyltransferase